MKTYIFLLSFLLLQMAVFSQKKEEPIEVTPAIEKKIAQEVSKEVGLLREKLKKPDNHEGIISYTHENIIEFTLDTFSINRYMTRYMEYDWSTAGMRYAGYEAANKYDSLLNKYYKKLMNILKPEDKKVLTNAQRAWISFRDSELKLIDVVGKDEYSGGGTMQQLIDASEYLDFITHRTIAIYQHYLRATQSY